MSVSRNVVKLKLNNIFKKQLDFDIMNCNEAMLNQKLVGDEFGIRPRHLLSIVVDIEKDFGITIPEEDILGGRIDTVNNLCDTVARQLEMK